MLGQSVLAILLFFGLTEVISEPVTKCKSDDSSCALKSAQALLPAFAAGLPEYKVKTLDPVSFKRIDATSNNLKLILSNVTVTGLKNCVMKKVKLDKAKNKLFLKVVCTCQLEGQYEMSGQLLVLHISGNGPLHVTMNKTEFNLDIDMGEKDIGGVPHWDIKGWKYTYNLKDKSYVEFENLFNGNELLAQAAKTVIAESGNEIILEVGPPVLKTVIQEVITQINSFFHAVPPQELSID